MPQWRVILFDHEDEVEGTALIRNDGEAQRVAFRGHRKPGAFAARVAVVAERAEFIEGGSRHFARHCFAESLAWVAEGDARRFQPQSILERSLRMEVGAGHVRRVARRLMPHAGLMGGGKAHATGRGNGMDDRADLVI